MNQMKWLRQGRYHVKKIVYDIIESYITNEIEYKMFSYKISPYIFKACDNKINDDKLKNLLLQVMELLTDYLDYEITTEMKLKYNLRHLIEK